MRQMVKGKLHSAIRGAMFIALTVVQIALRALVAVEQLQENSLHWLFHLTQKLAYKNSQEIPAGSKK